MRKALILSGLLFVIIFGVYYHFEVVSSLWIPSDETIAPSSEETPVAKTEEAAVEKDLPKEEPYQLDQLVEVTTLPEQYNIEMQFHPQATNCS